jgi:hypothetical protein
MLGRKILLLFLVVAASPGISCSLNPQPEPPFSSRSTDDTNGGQNGNDLSNPSTGSIPISAPTADAAGPAELDASTEHSLIVSGESGLDMKTADGGVEEGGDGEAESSFDAPPEVSEGGATSSD